jgi:hypothetical protein
MGCGERRKRRLLLLVAGCIAGLAVASTDAIAMGCGSGVSPAASALPEVVARPSLRLISVKQDSLLNSRWALMVDCEHPEWPARMVLLAGKEDAIEGLKFAAKIQSSSAAGRVPMMVRAGETVRAWRQDGMASLVTSGVAEQGGAVGQRIQVRLLRNGMDGQDAEMHVSGVVDGVGSVEIVQ